MNYVIFKISLVAMESPSRDREAPPLEDRPAIVIAVFGSSGRGRALLDRFHLKVVERFGEYDIRWAYTSRIIREKTGTSGLRETFVALEAAGFNSCVVLPLQIFPGSEYQKITMIADDFEGLHIIVGETLMHRWGFVNDVINVVSKNFLQPTEGLNILAMHGTPVTTDPANTVYLGVEQLVRTRFENVLAASIEGIPDYETMFAKMARKKIAEKYKRVRIHPLLLVAGKHVEQDIMGEEESWKKCLEKLGFTVEYPMVEHEDDRYYQSLGSSSEIEEFFLDRLAGAVQKFSNTR